MREFSAFTQETDPHGEHDFGAILVGERSEARSGGLRDRGLAGGGKASSRGIEGKADLKSAFPLSDYCRPRSGPLPSGKIDVFSTWIPA